MAKRKNNSYKALFDQIIEVHGSICVYCEQQVATTIDHVVPYSWDGDNALTNLVPACALCNSIAGDKIFEDVWHKRQYILERTKHRLNRQAICTACQLPFSYRAHSPSIFLCAQCYDIEYDTAYSRRKTWLLWKAELLDAGICAEAHLAVRKRIGDFSLYKKIDRSKIFVDALVQEYENFGM